MKIKDFEKISEPLREEGVTHLLMVKMRGGISLSSIASGNDLYEFLQVLVEQNPVMLDVMRAVVESREKIPVPKTPDMLN